MTQAHTVVRISERGAATRTALLAAAREVFTSVGFAQAGVTDIVTRAGASVGSLYHHFNGKADLSGDMALRIEKAFGVKMDTLMRMQSAYDIAQTRKREKEIRVRRILHTAGIHP